MSNRSIKTLNEAEEVHSLYVFQDTDDDVASVYAFDAPSKICFKGSSSAYAFWSTLFFSVWAYLQYVIAYLYQIDNNSIIAETVNSNLNSEVDTLKANKADDDSVSVYAFDNSDSPSTDADKDTDDVESVYAFDGADNDEIQSSDDTEGSVSSESSNSFGFTIPNLGEGEQYGYHADSDDERFDFYNNVTCVRLVTGESLTLAFDGQNLKVVIHDGKAYTSFDAMPSDVADLLIAARARIIDLVF
uniref:KTSC domain-containing protein n=1 Tax=Panagrellus redivivus TaxID=6233 RepID=A0A7E4VAU4_PANRE